MGDRETLTGSMDARDHAKRASEEELFVCVVWSPDESARGRMTRLDRCLVLGRQPGDGVDLVVRDGAISRQHVSFAPERGWVAVRDLGSRNGTFLDGARGAQWIREPPCLVRAGDTVLEVRRDVTGEDEEGPLLGRSSAMRTLRAEVRRIARSPLSVLLLGETGAGKELAAREIHEQSGRAGRFVAVNVAAISSTLFEAFFFGHERGAFTGAAQARPGGFEAATGGTLFLDEIAELPIELQPKLLRVLETREYTAVGSTEVRTSDARIVAATNAELESEVRAGTFREDLYARLAGGVVRVPPLRARRADVPGLARHFFASADPPIDPDWTPGFVEALLLHGWPMNVRELRTVVQRLALAGTASLERQHLEAQIGRPRAPDEDDSIAMSSSGS
jgi:DNA-binding NtrC family response regulator